MEIGEGPSEAANRELEEETGLRARSDGIIGCWSGRQVTYENGDRVHAIAILLRGQVLGGVERADRTGEIDARGWFAPKALPPLRTPWDQRVQTALSGAGPFLR